MSQLAKTSTSPSAALKENTAENADDSATVDRDVAEWVEQHGDYLFRYALMRMREHDIAEELVQETLLAAVKGRESFKGDSSARTWLIGILKHKILDHLRRIGRENKVRFDIGSGGDIDRYFDEHGKWLEQHQPNRWTTDPAQLTEQKEFFGVLQGCLSKLPDRLRHVFTLRELDDLTTEEICKELEITSTNLWVILYRARVKLRDCIETRWIKQGN